MHREVLRLDERKISRRILLSSVEPEDPGLGVRAEIGVTELHTRCLLGFAGPCLQRSLRSVASVCRFGLDREVLP